MDYTKLFYWLTVADNARVFFNVFAVLFGAIFVIAFICFLFAGMNSDKEFKKDSRTWTFWSAPFFILFLALTIGTPSLKNSLFIIAGGTTLNYLSTDSTAKTIPHELTTFVVSELKSLAKDAEVDLGISSQKDKILEEAKKMTAVELMDKMKADTSFARVITSQ